jgi:hypothetical protein
MRITTEPCMVCGETSEMDVSTTGWVRWKGGWLIQDAFPEMPAELREQLKLGTHPACFEAMFGEEDDEDSAKEADPRYVPGASESDDDMTDAEWAEAYGSPDDEDGCPGHPDDDWSINANLPAGVTHFCDGTCQP